MGEGQQVDPTKGLVGFCSALFGWAFTLTRFARIYAEKFKVPFPKMMDKLWGDNFFDQKGKKWKTEDVSDEGTTLKRCFV